jgi:hypothetical protein
VDTDRRLERVQRALSRDPWRPRYPWPSKGALERDERTTEKIHEVLAKAEAATSEYDRARWIGLAFTMERNRQYARTFPFEMWVRAAVPTAILVPWALLARQGYGWVGVLPSVAVGGALWEVRRRRRRRARPDA